MKDSKAFNLRVEPLNELIHFAVTLTSRQAQAFKEGPWLTKVGRQLQLQVLVLVEIFAKLRMVVH